MKISCKFQDRKIGSCATVWTSLWRRPDAPAVSSRLSWKRLDDRSSFSNFYTELNFKSWHCLESFCKTSRWRGNTSGCCPALQNILDFCSNAERSYSEDCPDARPSRPDVYLLWKELRYSGRRSQKTVRTLDRQNLNLSRFRISVSL
jgi:hypothetical protein